MFEDWDLDKLENPFTVPNDTYLVKVSGAVYETVKDSEFTPNKDGKKKRIVLSYQIVEGQYKDSLPLSENFRNPKTYGSDMTDQQKLFTMSNWMKRLVTFGFTHEQIKSGELKWESIADRIMEEPRFFYVTTEIYEIGNPPQERVRVKNVITEEEFQGQEEGTSDLSGLDVFTQGKKKKDDGFGEVPS